MSGQYNLALADFDSLKTVSKKIFKIISKQLNVNTAYVTKRGHESTVILSSYNENEVIIPEGYEVEHSGTYCQYVISNKDNAMTTTDLSKDELTREMEATSQLNVKGFLGVTLTDTHGRVFGTLCVMDEEEKEFNEEDIDFLKSMAGVLSHLIELDETKYNMALLNVPIIPITEGVSVLSVQGIIDEHRSDKITTDVLAYTTEHEMEYFIIDVSGLIIVDGDFPQELLNMVKSLKIMGVEPIITGITPHFAKHEADNVQLLKLDIKTVNSLQSALEYIGFSLVEHQV
ncbi:GAF domain-containing protein [Halobacillus yeomjeoni]|uniref:GAF domain-containing protein n=1 Tax=Halobacillus yeomjeoni TaxID=311194 RepID=A0A931MVN8_9BACI|nr:GAF domain-containing protein [Halobacillus yeomjeoni]MBH0230820.1 GAF domain-containing protein [Halobacillus yeomjeoni]